MFGSRNSGGVGVNKVKGSKGIEVEPYLLEYNGRIIKIQMIKKPRSRCAIVVYKDRIVCRFPISKNEAITFINTKKQWIYKRFLEQEQEAQKLKSKEWGCLIMGREIPIVLNVNESAKLYPRKRWGEQISDTKAYITKYGVVELTEVLTIHSPIKLEIDQVHDAVREWKIYFSNKFLEYQTERIYNKAFNNEFEMPKIQTKICKSYFGKNFKRKKIIYNALVINQPKEYITFVIIHELCHCLEMNHNKTGFYALMERVLPNYKAYRKTRIVDGRDY